MAAAVACDGTSMAPIRRWGIQLPAGVGPDGVIDRELRANAAGRRFADGRNRSTDERRVLCSRAEHTARRNRLRDSARAPYGATAGANRGGIPSGETHGPA